ncbi:hypothetical protein KSP39_PZI013162 [Platanthera zijinensis]|uniref:Uncharacterized protein n=1 Tax=Platanthera zijinensis TaxID=2320716 RepID=A0AAP0BD56_9ASPA
MKLKKQRVDALVKYVLCRFLFLLKSLRLSLCLEMFSGLNEFRKYNWLKDIHTFLHKQFEDLHTLDFSRNKPASPGYLEVCSIILVFFEHTNIQVSVDEKAQPHLCRWAAKGGFSYIFCEDLPILLFPKKEVRPTFVYLNKEE